MDAILGGTRNDGFRLTLSAIKVIEIVLGEHLEEQEMEIDERKNFKVIFHSLGFYGLCGNCM